MSREIERVFRAPYATPNGLQATEQGLWIVDQCSDRVALVEITEPNNYGVTRLLSDIPSESSNTSGLTYGGGALWLAANGPADRWRVPRPTDANSGQVLKVDTATGRTMRRYDLPGGGGTHGIEYDNFEEGIVWLTTLAHHTISKVRIEDWSVVHTIPLQYDGAHGLVRVEGGIWAAQRPDRTVLKLDLKDGKELDRIEIPNSLPEPHGAFDLRPGPALLRCVNGVGGEDYSVGESNCMPTVQHDVLREMTFSIFKAIGIPEEDARTVGDHLVDSNLNGHDSHGVARIPGPGYAPSMTEQYVKWPEHEIVRETPALAVIDGNGANGIVAMEHALRLVAEKSRRSTIGIVALRNVTHIGRLGYYPPRIAEQGMIGMVWTNVGGLFMAPFGSADARLRPTPIAFAVPRRDGPPFMLDMSLSVVAGGKVREKIVRDQPVPEGWMIDTQGNYVTDGEQAFNNPDVGVLPLGGLQFGHKGYGLAMMMEMIVGPLSLAGCTKGEGKDDGGNGVMVMAIDIESFTDIDVYTEEVEGLATWVSSARPLPGVERIYVPGEIELETYQRRLKDGIDVPDQTWAKIGALAKELSVTMPKV